MKVAFLTPEYPHSSTGSSGGIGTSIKNLAKGLSLEGVYVRVLVYGQKGEGVFDDEGVQVQRIKNVKWKGLSWWLTRKKLERLINQLYEEGTIDLVEAPDWTGITSCITPKKCPIIIRLNGSDTYFCHLDQRPVKWWNKFHERRALQKADGLLSVSQFTANLTNQVFGLNNAYEVIPNPIDGVSFEPSKGGNENNDSILYFGSLIRKKGVLELPLIFNRVIENNPKAELFLLGKDVPDAISGNSSTWEMMKNCFSSAAISSVNFLGSVPYEKVKEYIERASVCVFPSFAEAFPVSWLEAMAMEKAIVASDIGWAKEMITDGKEGFLVNPKNHEEFALKINNLLQDAVVRKKLGEAARKKIENNFCTSQVVQQNVAYYSKIIKK